ncbi:TSUP family transporter, partial [bacterium]|nr:TSUP family transporter [bacterium]
MLQPVLDLLSNVDIQLLLLAFFTSAVAGVFGFGGGMLLIASLPNFLPPQALVPVHTVVQLASNVSRALFALRYVQWRFFAAFAVGGLLGIVLFGLLYRVLELRWLPAIIGFYILLNTWHEDFKRLFARLESLPLLGALQTGVALFVGAPGPMAMPLLLKRLSDKHQIVATMAIFMTFSHAVKLLFFLAIGFSFSEYYASMLWMVFAAVLGSYAGTAI